jgi:hypothetical protein
MKAIAEEVRDYWLKPKSEREAAESAPATEFFR